MEKADILKAFNNHLSEFLEDLNLTFPESEGIKYSKSGFERLRKANPKILISLFKRYIYDFYLEDINNSNLTKFIEKDYTWDCRKLNPETSEYVKEQIDLLREPIKEVSNDQENKEKAVKYMKNFCKLCEIYYS